ncbi:hypothetical protein, partial [Cupriavidus gilardii]|uniref:hypothetical protein n=1 Tax=Cupriavidus gilardii TaxID=82541 RepID=UPI001246E85B
VAPGAAPACDAAAAPCRAPSPSSSQRENARRSSWTSVPVGAPGVGTGKPCPECGAHALHKVDGCAKCANCGYVGECG